MLLVTQNMAVPISPVFGPTLPVQMSQNLFNSSIEFLPL